MWLPNNQFKASMKCLLINKQTGEQTLCDKVTIDGFDYYASKVEVRLNDPITNGYAVWLWKDDCSLLGIKKVIATNNPDIDIPQVVDEVEKLAREFAAKPINPINPIGSITCLLSQNGFEKGYNKSQETHPFSEEDLIEFNEWCETSAEANLFWRRNRIELDMSGKHHEIIKQKRKELLQLWKEQKPKKVYYNLLFNTK